MDNHTALTNDYASSVDHSVEYAIELLDQALTIADGEQLMIAAAKIDDARNALRGARGEVACISPL